MDGICNQIVLKPETLGDQNQKKFLFSIPKTIYLSKYQIEIIINVLDSLEEYGFLKFLKSPNFPKKILEKKLQKFQNFDNLKFGQKIV